MKIKTSELSGVALDWAVAKCEGYNPDHNPTDLYFSTDWEQGGPIIERESIQLARVGGLWEAWIDEGPFCKGQTPLIAAMRCYVASKLGEEVEVPEEVCDENL